MDAVVLKGGQGSGNFGHAGRPGLVGGSAPRKGAHYFRISAGMGLEPGFSPEPSGEWSEDSRLSSLINDNLPESWSENRWFSATQATRGAVKNELVTAISEISGEPYELVNKFVAQWKYTSSKAVASIDIQEAAHEYFGGVMSEWQEEQRKANLADQQALIEKHRQSVAEENPEWDSGHVDKEALSRAKAEAYYQFPLTSRKRMNKILGAMYKHTQAKLAQAGFKPDDYVTVYRGFKTIGDPHQFKPGETIKYVGNCIESWSLSLDVANKYGNIRVAMRVPVKNIVSTCRTGIGCLKESEVVIPSIPGATAYVINNDFVGKEFTEKGGAGSGNFGHAGRPGKVGGSAPKGGGLSAGVEGLSDAEILDAMKTTPDKVYDFLLDGFYEDANRLKDKICNKLSAMAGVGYETANNLLAGWAGGWNAEDNTETRSPMFAYVVSKEFGIEIDESDAMIREGEELFEKATKDLKYLPRMKEEVLPLFESEEALSLGILGDGLKLEKLEDFLNKKGVDKELVDISQQWVVDAIWNTDVGGEHRPIIKNTSDAGWFEKVVALKDTQEMRDYQRYQRLARAMYENTQKRFAEQGLKPDDEIILFRGLSFPEGFGSEYIDRVRVGSKSKVKQRVISSWTTDYKIAKRFSEGWDEGSGGLVLSKKFKVKDIFASCVTGLGCFEEEEFITFPTDSPAAVVYIQNGATGRESELSAKEFTEKGGKGSGHFGHSGRPGKVGGSSPAGVFPGLDTGGALTTEMRYTDARGNWEPERAKLHQQIVDRAFAGLKPVENPVSYLLGGGTASGKSTLITSGRIELPENAVRIDSDEIKEHLPEYSNPADRNDTTAAIVHEESSHISKLMMVRAAKEGYNIVLDGTGDSTQKSLLRKIKTISKNGQRPVIAIYATISLREAFRRNKIRREQTGRNVPPEVVRFTHTSVSRIFPKFASDKRLFSEVRLYETMGEPKLVASGGKGQLTIHDAEAYKRFVDKASDDYTGQVK